MKGAAFDFNFDGFIHPWERWFSAAAAAVLVPVFSLVADPTFLHDLFHQVVPSLPTVYERLISVSLAGLVGFLLYSIDPHAKAAQDIAKIEADTQHTEGK